MKTFADEGEVRGMADSPAKRALAAMLDRVHACLPELEFDALVDGGGPFLLLEVGDDPASVPLYEEGEPLDLTDLQARCYEFVSLSEDESTFALYLVTSDLGGPCFFVPNEPWIGSAFRRALAEEAAREG
ncbi:hypothetical protein GMSM_42680 [Geomonas sp. Red276]